MVPTLLCDVLVAQDLPAGGRTYRAGEILTMAYGPALILKAVGGISAIVDAELKHLEAQEQIAIYGADCFFPAHQQTISRVADYLAAAEGPPKSVH